MNWRWWVFCCYEWTCGHIGHPGFMCRHVGDLWVWADPEMLKGDYV